MSFQQDLFDAHARALERDPSQSEEELADSEEVAEVLKRYTRPEPVYSQGVKDRAAKWRDRLLSAD